MAIIQISKLQQRSGNLVDLPQLDNAEFGWASDDKRLFIGGPGSTGPENVEVLTSYSNISFSQITGSDGGNFNISTPQDGQILSYNSSLNVWQNAGGNSDQPGNSTLYSNTNIHLGNVSNVKMGGGAVGYVLSTDGIGNLSWTPKGSIVANIEALSNANPIVMTVSNSIPFVNGSSVTITGVQGANANSIVNGQSFYLTLAVDYNTSGNVKLYTDVGRTTGANGYYLTATANTGIATSVISGGGSGSSAGGANTSVQFNDQNISNGVAGFTFNKNTTTLTIAGPVNASAISATSSITSPTLISNIATGTAPLTVTSTTRVANLNVATSGIANTVNDASQPNITSVGTLVSLSVTGNVTAGNIGAPTGVVSGQSLSIAQDMSGGTLTVSGNANIGNIGTGGLITATGNINGGNIVTSGIISSTGNANVGNLGTSGLITATGNITGANLIGNHYGNGSALSSLIGANVTGAVAYATTANSVAGANVAGAVAYATIANSVAGANVSGAVAYATTANSVAGANVSGAVAYATTANAVAGANVIGAVAYATTANAVAGANVSGQVANALVAGTVYTAAQPNITSVGTLTSLSVSGTAIIGTVQTINITTGANTTAGTLTGNWSLSSGSRLQATYADLAEYYEADQVYPPGTVLQFGGDKEVTISEDGSARVAGVVSTNPAYAMNATCPGIAVAIALQGRVPTKVKGTIQKGDMMISGPDGFARPSSSPAMGTVIGKALQDFNGVEGIIEIAVGRL